MSQPISRRDALKLSSQIIEQAEAERLPPAMSQPTVEEVAEIRSVADALRYTDIIALCDAYMAQGRALERKVDFIKMQDEFIMDKSALAAERSTRISQLEVDIEQLQAENQALKARLLQLEAQP